VSLCVPYGSLYITNLLDFVTDRDMFSGAVSLHSI
jgi:hypothetical protein